MAMTQLWNRFGQSILTSPHLTLAAFLGHAPSIHQTKQQSIEFPKTADFQFDPAYDPNFHKLDLDEDCLNSAFLIKCVCAWGAEALVRAVNACSLLQCMHHSSCTPKFRQLRNEAAFSLQALIDFPTADVRKEAGRLLQKCQALYRPHEENPDSTEANETWYHLGASWFGLETALSNMAAREDCGEKEPAPANSSWCRRETVWPERAVDAAARWSSHALARAAVRSTLLAWAICNCAEPK